MFLPTFLENYSKIVSLQSFDNEFETMRLVQSLETRQNFDQTLSYHWNNLKEKSVDNIDDMVKKAKLLLEEGNKMFANTENSSQLAACRLYTRALFAAPPDSNELGTAHANRGVALKLLGFYQQAYDDFRCTASRAYPDISVNLMEFRQAWCAYNMGDVVALNLHLVEIEKMELNDSFAAERQKLRDYLQTLLSIQVAKQDNEMVEDPNDKIHIVEAPGSKRYSMVASQKITKGDLIFTESATSVIQSGQKMCTMCAITFFIPFPCTLCRGPAVYCSIKCRIEDQPAHVYECPGYRHNIYQSFPEYLRLAFRMMHHGLSNTLWRLSRLRSANELWAELSDNKTVVRSYFSKYGPVLRMMNALDNMTVKAVERFALLADVLVLYLKKYTKFFDLFADSLASRSDWELITASLILLHLGQLEINSKTRMSIVPRTRQFDPSYSVLLADELQWTHAFRLNRGLLHNFDNFETVSICILPNFSVLNHSCQPSFVEKFSGRQCSAYAAMDIPEGDEVYQSYANLDYRSFRRRMRRAFLLKMHNFMCECDMCASEYPDDESDKFNRMQCENTKCRQRFVFYLPEMSMTKKIVICTICGSRQHMKWFEGFQHQLGRLTRGGSPYTLFESYEICDNWLVGYNQMKLKMASSVVEKCFEAHKAGFLVTDKEFEKLAEILKFILSGFVDLFGCESLQYAAKMTYLWDIIALGNYKCPRKEMEYMLRSVDFLSDEVKTIFLNYYKDYIEQLLS